MKELNIQHPQVLGIDVAKTHLDVYLHPSRGFARFANDDAGAAALLQWISPHRVTLTVVEATGGLEVPVLLALHEAKLSVARVNPRWIKDFSRAGGTFAKTDQLDAKPIARYGQTMQPTPWNPPSPDALELKAFCARRRQLLQSWTMENNRRQQSSSAYLVRQHLQQLQFIEGQLKEVDRLLDRMVDANEEWSRKKIIIESIPGVGRVTAMCCWRICLNSDS